VQGKIVLKVLLLIKDPGIKRLTVILADDLPHHLVFPLFHGKKVHSRVKILRKKNPVRSEV
jgi:hypothetical protein